MNQGKSLELIFIIKNYIALRKILIDLVKKLFYICIHSLGLFLLACQDKIQAQDKINLKDGTVVICQITEIQDFILYAEILILFSNFFRRCHT